MLRRYIRWIGHYISYHAQQCVLTFLPCLLQPEDWDDEEDGEWTAPTIPNPEYKGPWKQKVRLLFLFIQKHFNQNSAICIFMFNTLVSCTENQEPQLPG